MLTETNGPELIAEVASRKTGIHVTKLGQSDKKMLTRLVERLYQRVEMAVVAEAVLRSRAEWGMSQQSTCSFLLLGPTGVGKTVFSKALAKQLFDDENLLMRIDMSEYME